MPPIELGPTRPVGAIDVRLARHSAGQGARPAQAEGSSPSVVKSDALDPGAAPVDTDRVALIRKAIESGEYPIVPAKVADAIIAAGLLLRKGN